MKNREKIAILHVTENVENFHHSSRRQKWAFRTFWISELQNFCVFKRIIRFRMSESSYFQLKVAAAQAITVKLEGNDENFLQSQLFKKNFFFIIKKHQIFDQRKKMLIGQTFIVQNLRLLFDWRILNKRKNLCHGRCIFGRFWCFLMMKKKISKGFF